MSALTDYIRFRRKAGLFQVIYHVTRRCNSRCLSCFSWKRELVATPELDLGEIRKITASLPGFPWLLLSGGEPSLRSDLPEIVFIFCQTNGVRHVTLPTNALLPERITAMTERICGVIGESTMNLVLSIDGIGEEHDRLRGCPGNFDALMKTWESVKPLKSRLPNLSVKFHTVLSNLNYTRFDEIRDFVERLRPDVHTFDFIRGAPASDSVTLPPEEALPELAGKIKAVLRHYGGYERLRRHHRLLKATYAAVMDYYYDEFFRIRRERRQTIRCLADRATLVLGASGEASLCEMLEPFGSFREHDYNYDSLVRTEASRAARKAVADGSCYCYHPCYQTINILFQPTRLALAMARRFLTAK
jgi:MoaA/NifB/PqqE/SkfB family radical SAM enzyme